MKNPIPMLLLILALQVFLFSQTAFAALDLLRPRPMHRISVDPRSGAGQTYFDLAQETYRRGVSFDPGQLSGVYVGRCYYVDAPMKPIASLVVLHSEDSQQHGPNLKRYTRIVPLVDRNSSPYRYDHLDRPNMAKELAQIKGLAEDFNEELAIPVESRRETYVVGLRTPDEDSRLYRYRRVDNELHLRLECAEDQVCLGVNANLGRQTVLAFEGQPIAHCRYFKRIGLSPNKHTKVPTTTKTAEKN